MGMVACAGGQRVTQTFIDEGLGVFHSISFFLFHSSGPDKDERRKSWHIWSQLKEMLSVIGIVLHWVRGPYEIDSFWSFGASKQEA